MLEKVLDEFKNIGGNSPLSNTKKKISKKCSAFFIEGGKFYVGKNFGRI